MSVSFTKFASEVRDETAFAVLAIAKRLKAAGKRVIELEIGDSPFPSTPAAKQAGHDAIDADQSHYAPSLGIPPMREAAARYVRDEHGIDAQAENVVVGPGAKIFELIFCEAFVDPGDDVLVFSPYFPTYLPNIARRGGRVWMSDLKQSNEFRPEPAEVERFLKTAPRPKAIFLNSPHNPTGGVAAESDLTAIADLIRGRDVAVLSDEPYDQMVWQGRHHSILAQPGMMEQCVAAYTFSKSYSMSGWRAGFAVSAKPVIDLFGRLLNTSLSCVAPIVQLAAAAALTSDRGPRGEQMKAFRDKLNLLVAGLNTISGFKCLEPRSTFYAFPNVAAVCNQLRITSHGLALYLLEGADDSLGVACLGGECFGPAGGGFLRFSCAEPDDRLLAAVEFVKGAITRQDRVAAYLETHPQHRLTADYSV
ncbi:MAG: aminotransferase class I/II-fold pyridoxal phosphate-dependent enzyme [Planctomycetaceae bacterium]|nr:aminotransferase class I/II-fold pyridoxal phosphate-dependent enzyme [Planctomycetaceae bacterium]